MQAMLTAAMNAQEPTFKTRAERMAEAAKTNPELLNVSQTINSCMHLFEGNVLYSISFHDSTSGELQILADKDQFRRALNNLIKNAIQSVPENRKGIIQLFLNEGPGIMELKISTDLKNVREARIFIMLLLLSIEDNENRKLRQYRRW